MKLSAPISRLKRQAKRVSRTENIPLHAALDQIAAEEGQSGWSVLAAKASKHSPANQLLSHLAHGDMVLLGARPGQGKTLLSLELALEAAKTGRRGVFFTLEYTAKDVQERLRAIGAGTMQGNLLFTADCSDAISADYIMLTLASAPRGTLAIVDYLQLLDQKRDTPALETQIRALRDFARERGLILVFIAQIDRAFEASKKQLPDLRDVRLPNPLDLKLFDKACFLNKGVVQVQAVH
ncbi:DNA helicase [Methylovirgula sp. 4M-Z18]|uniref:DNA helicase n=1 Tax=Methylovirgula sp. 4M-Z18 TaxID=2293567 RepID=UPI000E2F1DDE|nr:DNA helicase [Methylovirgula sp. 4M-Z18]RFB79105.1 DNA helicase [Methylovirgula sp. 4M-Z18]